MPDARAPQILHLPVKNLGCASCAARIESSLRDLPGVAAADLDFAAARLRLALDGSVAETELLAQADAIVHAIEPEACLLASRPHSESLWKSLPRPRLIRLAAGLPLAAAAWLLPDAGWLRLALFLAAWLVFGYDVLLAAVSNLKQRQWFDENFLMSAATIGALAIGEYGEAVVVMLFYQIGEICQQMAVDHSRRSIRALLDIRPEQASLITAEGVVIASPGDIRPGDRILVRPGERIALDSRVLEGESALDTAALTGESLPRPVGPGDEALAGCINGSGLLTLEVTRPFGESAVSRILALVEQASARKASAEQFITRFAAVYTPVMIGLALLMAVLPPLLTGGPFTPWISRALILLVISCPCALVLSVPLTYFAGLGAASARGILIKGGAYLEKMARPSAIVFDKTGTLTEGRFTVTRIETQPGFEENEILRLACLAESHSGHPIAESVLTAWQRAGNALPDPAEITDYQDIPGRGVILSAGGRQVLLGNRRLMIENNIANTASAEEVAEQTGTALELAVDGRLAGRIWLDDRIRPSAAETIAALRRAGVAHFVLLSGDRWPAARQIAGQAGIEQVYAELLPEQKVTALEQIMAEHGDRGSVLYVGDGINDAPVLARADVGIALGAASDAALESADMVLIGDDLAKLPDSLDLARRTVRIVRQNITLALGLKALVLVLAALGAADIWQAVFADVGVALLAVFNALRVIIRRRAR